MTKYQSPLRCFPGFSPLQNAEECNILGQVLNLMTSLVKSEDTEVCVVQTILFASLEDAGLRTICMKKYNGPKYFSNDERRLIKDLTPPYA